MSFEYSDEKPPFRQNPDGSYPEQKPLGKKEDEATRTPVIDPTQTNKFEDKSFKHTAYAIQMNQVSLDLDFWSAVSFRRYMKREADSYDVFVNAWKTWTDEQNVNRTEQIADHDQDIEWGDGSNARVLVSGELLDEPCTVTVEWNWKQNPNARQYRKVQMSYRAETFMPTYADLEDDERLLADAILGRFSLLRDNHYGQGMPNLAEDAQTSYSLEDVAKAMHIALGRVNMNPQALSQFIIGPGTGQHFPKMFYNLLMTRTLIELIRQIDWGYLETPDIAGSPGVAYADRKAYYEKWKAERKDLEADAKVLEDNYTALMIRSRLTNSSVLVGGGLYGSGYGMMSNRMTNAIERGWLQNAYIPINVINGNVNR
jgi:hypothetical protein